VSLASDDVNAAPRVPKVIYVIGAGRSGSTILGVTLGNCDEVFFAGELDKWLTRSGEPKLKDAPRVEFWSSVRALIGDSQVPFGGEAHHFLERSSALFRPRRRSVRKGLREPYRRVMSELFGAVAATAGARYVVDSSHYPLRARELQSVQGIELYLLLLVRDPRDVVASFAKDDVVERQFSPATTRAYLALTYLVSAWVFLRHPRERRVVLHYEDLIADPAGVLRELLEHVGSQAEPPDFGALSTGTPLHGNRLLDREIVSLAPRDAGARVAERLPARLFARLLLAGIGRLRPAVKPRSARAGSSSSAGELVG
jgi:Sulfotransferase family